MAKPRVSERAVRAELNLLLYKQAPGGIAANILVALLLGWFIWEHDRQGAIPGWLMLNLAGNIWRFIPMMRVLRTYKSLNMAAALQDDSYLAIYTAGCAVMGLGWGLTPFILVSPDSGLAGSMVFAVMVAIISASSLTLSFRPVAQTAFIFSVAIPTMSWIGMQYGSEYTTFALLGLAYGVVLLFAGWSYSRLAAGSIRIRLQNQRLVGSLSNARDKAEKANTELRSEVGLRRELQERLQREKDRLGVTLQAMDSGVVVVDSAGCIEFINPKAELFLGQGIGKLRGQTISEQTHFYSEGSREGLPHPVTQCLDDNRQIEMLGSAVLAFTGSERRIPVDVTVTPISRGDAAPQGAVMVMHDMSEVRAQMREMAHQTRHDSLTGLMNRREFESRLNALVASTTADGPMHVLCYLDLDRFKPINDTAGHRAGDEFLKCIATLLSEQIRGSDLVARVGGDEFNVLLEDCPVDVAERIAEKIRSRIAEYRFEWEEHVFNVGVSIGMAMIDGEITDPAELMHRADAACYAAKQHGRNQVRTYQSDDHAVWERNTRPNEAGDLHLALEQDRLQLRFENAHIINRKVELPQYVEVQLTSIDDAPRMGPQELMASAERAGLAAEFDRWTIKHLLQGLRQESRNEVVSHGNRAVYAVNLSGQSIAERNFLEYLQQILATSGVAGDRLVFEIDAIAALADLGGTARFMYAMNRHGVRFAIDEFDGEMSAFNTLRELPISFLKLGGRLVANLADEPHAVAALTTLVDMAHTRSMQTIALNAPADRAILEQLRGARVDYVQGRAATTEQAKVDDQTVARRGETTGRRGS